MPANTPPAPPRVLGRIVLVGLSVWLHAADTLVTATMAPAIVGELGGIAYINWLITIYEVGAVIAGAATAVASLRFGLRAVFLAATLLYGAGCAVAALAPDMRMLLVGRLLQGLGGGALLALSYVAIYQWFEERWWNRLMGTVAAIWGVGSLLGPLLGGLFAEPHAWRVVFWLLLSLSLLLIGLVLLLSPSDSRSASAPTAWPLATIAVLTAGTLLIAQSGVAATAPGSLADCVAGLALLYGAARIDRRAGVRLVPPELLQLKTPLGAGLAMVFALAVGTTAFWTYGPLVLKILFNLAPLTTGYLLALEAIAWALGTLWISARPVANQGLLIRVGIFVVAAGAAGFALTVPAGTLVGMGACAIAQGLGFGLAWPAIVTRIVKLGQGEETLASAAPATLQRIGYAVGTAVSGVFAKFAGLGEQTSVQAAHAAGFWVFAGFVPLLLAGLWAGWRFTAARTD